MRSIRAAARFFRAGVIGAASAVAFAITFIANILGPREIALLAGIALIGYGASLVYVPAAYLVPGGILTAVAVYGLK